MVPGFEHVLCGYFGRNTLRFERNERPLDLLKFLLFGTLFQWACILGFTQCISISNFLESTCFSSWVICICFISECLLSWCSSISIKFQLPTKKKNVIRKLHSHLVMFRSFYTLSINVLPIYILNFCVIFFLHFEIKCLFEARDNLFQFIADTLWLLSWNNVPFVLPFIS